MSTLILLVDDEPNIQALARLYLSREGYEIETVSDGPAEIRSLAETFNEMAAQVQASQQSQRDFVANVSHDLKTPLTSIQGFAQALQDGTASEPVQIQEAAGIIQAEAERMHRLVTDLLDLARWDAGTVELQRDPVNLDDLLQSVISQLAPQATEAQVEVVYHPGSIPHLAGDADRLTQVFTNLLDNAIRHSPAQGQVRIAVDLVDDLVQVSISDQGPGIPPDEQHRIFECFYQVDKSRSGGGQRGTGLGLAIAHQIMLAHGGQIAVQNAPGQGCTFMVKLPFRLSDDSTSAGRIG